MFVGKRSWGVVIVSKMIVISSCYCVLTVVIIGFFMFVEFGVIVYEWKIRWINLIKYVFNWREGCLYFLYYFIEGYRRWRGFNFMFINRIFSMVVFGFRGVYSEGIRIKRANFRVVKVRIVRINFTTCVFFYKNGISWGFGLRFLIGCFVVIFG